MRKILITLLLLSAFSVQAQVRLLENFLYPVGDSIGAHGWTGFSGFGVNVINVVAPGLTFPGYVNSNIGNAVLLNLTGQDSYKELSVPDSTGSFYLSFMMIVDTARAGDYFIGLLPTINTTNYNLRIHIKSIEDNRYVFGIGKGNTTDVIYGTAPFNRGSSVLVVGKYTFVEGAANDSLSLYAFMAQFPVSEPFTPVVGPYSGTTSSDMQNVGKVALRQGTATQAPKLIIDGVMLSKSWPKLIPTGVNDPVGIADKFSLSQNYPNPFNPNTIINYKLSVAGNISLNIYDANGKLIKLLESGYKQAGNYETNFSAAGLSSGIYYYSLFADGVLMDTKKAILMK